jgi:hypothetical protein
MWLMLLGAPAGSRYHATNLLPLLMLMLHVSHDTSNNTSGRAQSCHSKLPLQLPTLSTLIEIRNQMPSFVYTG